MEFELSIISHRAQVLCMVGLEYLSLKFYFQRPDFPTGGELNPRAYFVIFVPCCPSPQDCKFWRSHSFTFVSSGNQTDH